MRMRRWVPTLVLLVLLAPAAAYPQTKPNKSGVYEQLNLFGEAFERIRLDAVEPVADRKLIETAIAGMLAGLDPHSSYLSETEYKALQTPPWQPESARPGSSSPSTAGRSRWCRRATARPPPWPASSPVR